MDPSDRAGAAAVPATVLVTGCSGFIGRHLVPALRQGGFRVLCANRHGGPVHADFTRDHHAAAWLPRLANVDVVINAVGILREHGAQSFDAIHVQAPRALFAACAELRIRRVIQISALGADESAQSGYHLSKKAADEFLLSLPLDAVVVQPSLVYGPGGTSAKLFTTWASAPLVPLPGKGGQRVQPIHIDDVVACICALAQNDIRGRVALVGAEAMTLKAFLGRMRHTLQLPAPVFVPVPSAIMKSMASLSSCLPGSLLDTETLAMLERGNTADVEATRQLLGREPRPVSEFITDARSARVTAKLAWLLPALRFSVAAVWLVTGIVSFGVYPVSESYALLARVGIVGMAAPVMLYGAALLDVVFGVATLAMKRRRMLWLAQMAVIAGYSAIITWKLPEFWLHPYGPILKNLPMLAALWLLYELED
jgi:nucleoside-diphosphate-sugar epimerase